MHHHGDNWEDEIRAHIGPHYVVMGVGSRIRGDDAAGPLIAEGLGEKGLTAFDCGGVPENYITKVEKIQPADVIFVDAVDFGEHPGTIELFGGERFDAQCVSTHCAGLSPVMEYLSSVCEARCWVLAIQPESVGHTTEVSEAVRKAVERVVASAVWAS